MSNKRSPELLALETKYRCLRESLPPIMTHEPQPERSHRGPLQHPLARMLQLSTDLAEHYEPSAALRTAPFN